MRQVRSIKRVVFWAVCLAVVCVSVTPSAWAQNESNVDPQKSLADNLNANSAAIQAYAAASFLIDLDLIGSERDRPFSLNFLIMRFANDTAAHTAMRITPWYYAAKDDRNDQPQEVSASKIGDDRVAVYAGNTNSASADAYFAVRLGSVVFYAEIAQSDENPLAPLVAFARGSLDCLASHNIENNDDLAYCLPTFDLMPTGLEEYSPRDPADT